MSAAYISPDLESCPGFNTCMMQFDRVFAVTGALRSCLTDAYPYLVVVYFVGYFALLLSPFLTVIASIVTTFVQANPESWMTVMCAAIWDHILPKARHLGQPNEAWVCGMEHVVRVVSSLRRAVGIRLATDRAGQDIIMLLLLPVMIILVRCLLSTQAHRAVCSTLRWFDDKLYIFHKMLFVDLPGIIRTVWQSTCDDLAVFHHTLLSSAAQVVPTTRTFHMRLETVSASVLREFSTPNHTRLPHARAAAAVRNADQLNRVQAAYKKVMKTISKLEATASPRTPRVVVSGKTSTRLHTDIEMAKIALQNAENSAIRAERLASERWVALQNAERCATDASNRAASAEENMIAMKRKSDLFEQRASKAEERAARTRRVSERRALKAEDVENVLQAEWLTKHIQIESLELDMKEVLKKVEEQDIKLLEMTRELTSEREKVTEMKDEQKKRKGVWKEIEALYLQRIQELEIALAEETGAKVAARHGAIVLSTMNADLQVALDHARTDIVDMRRIHSGTVASLVQERDTAVKQRECAQELTRKWRANADTIEAKLLMHDMNVKRELAVDGDIYSEDERFLMVPDGFVQGQLDGEDEGLGVLYEPKDDSSPFPFIVVDPPIDEGAIPDTADGLSPTWTATSHVILNDSSTLHDAEGQMASGDDT